MVIEELNELPEADVQQVAAFVHELRESQVAREWPHFSRKLPAACAPKEADELFSV